MTSSLSTRRLHAGDERIANDLFELISDVFEVPGEHLDDIYVEQLLAQPTFRCYVTFVDGELAGGLTAHILPMTRSMSSEMFIYDLAVRPTYQCRGVGTALVRAALDDATRDSIDTTFVPRTTTTHTHSPSTKPLVASRHRSPSSPSSHRRCRHE
jgi:aminoglycoside 3-N-acetyltransferase I